MIDFSELSPGDKLGCRYTFTAGAIGTFSNLGSTPNDGRKVKDPLIVDGSYFEAIAPPDPYFVPITSAVQLLTKRTFPTTDTVLVTGTVSETNDYVDLSLYKTVISFSSTVNPPLLTAIPKDVILQTKDLIGINDFASAINSITVSVSNLFCKVAVTTDGIVYYTYDTVNHVWIVVDMNQTTDILKTVLADYTDINALVTADYPALTLNGKLGFKLLIGIDGVDTTKTYTLNSITIDYVGTNDDTPSIQYFNFVFAGYTKEGNVKLIADKPIQTAIAYSTLYNANVVFGRTKIPIANSEILKDFYIRLLDSGISAAYLSEYDALIAGNAIPTGTKTNVEFWDTSLGTLTRTIATLADDDGVVAGTTNIISRGGVLLSKYNNVDRDNTSANHGFRPVLIVDLHTPVEKKPGSAFPVVSTTTDLVPGKSISCEYIASTAGVLGTFKNLGTATKGYLNDFNNATPNGTFFFNCVGYTKEGKLKLVADRVIQTGISLSAIYTGNTPSIVSGKRFSFDRQNHTIRLLNALADKQPIVSGGEYDDLINNSLNTAKTVDEIWHTNNCLSWTNAISIEKTNFIIAKGFGDEALTATNQRHIPYLTTSPHLGFRPVLIIEPAIKVELLSVVPYVGYEKQDAAKNLEIDIVVTLSDNTLGQYALIKKDTSAVLSDYATTKHRTIDVTQLNSGALTTISIVEKVSHAIIDEFTVFRDGIYRDSSTRTFGEIYGGYELSNIEISNVVAKPKDSAFTISTINDTASYIDISKNTNKIIVG